MSIEVTVSLSEYAEDDSLEDRIIAEASNRLVEKLTKDSAAKLNALVDQLIQSEVRERLLAETASILENGWASPGDSFSGTTTKKQTVYGVISDAVALVGKDRYGKLSLGSLVNESLAKQFSTVMADGVKQIKAKLDQVVNEVIDETITGEIKSKIRAALTR